MSHDVQRQSPVLSQVVDNSMASVAGMPMHARRKLNRLAIQVPSLGVFSYSHVFKSSVQTSDRAANFRRITSCTYITGLALQ